MAEEKIEEAKVEEIKEEEAPPEPTPEPTPEPVPEPDETPPEPEPAPEPPPVEEPPVDVEKGKISKAQLDEVKAGQFYTISQLARKLGYGKGWVYTLVQTGRIKAVKPWGGTWRIPPSEVERIMTEGIPPMPREKPELDATEIVIDGKHADRVDPKPKEDAPKTKTVNLLEFLMKPEKKEGE